MDLEALNSNQEEDLEGQQEAAASDTFLAEDSIFKPNDESSII